MVAFQKRWPVMRVKLNMISKEWCMEMDQISQLKWDMIIVSHIQIEHLDDYLHLNQRSYADFSYISPSA